MSTDRKEELQQRLGKGGRIAVLTGAGVSAESGVPTFRGADGLWRKYRAEDLATLEAFQRDPKLVWEWYDWRRQLIAGCQPNMAHHGKAGEILPRLLGFPDGSVHNFEFRSSKFEMSPPNPQPR